MKSSMRICCVGAITVVCAAFVIAQEKNSTTQRITFGLNLSRNAIATMKPMLPLESKITVSQDGDARHVTLTAAGVGEIQQHQVLRVHPSQQQPATRQLGRFSSNAKKVIVTLTD